MITRHIYLFSSYYDILIIGGKMKKLLEKIAGILIVLAIVVYFIAFYPLKVSVNQDGEAECESLIGIKVGC